MIRTRKIVKVAMVSLGVILLVGVAGGFWFWHEFHLNISQSDMEPVETMLKKALSDALVVKRPDSKPTIVSGGYILAYQNDPEGFRKDAKLLDAWMASTKLGLAALKNSPPGNWVRSSADADYVASQDRVDPWNHTFCLLRRDDHLLVVSGGPKAAASPACRDIGFRSKDLAKLPHGKLLESPAGYLMIIVDRTQADRANR